MESAILAGLTEVILTHPLDHMKTLYQENMKFNNFVKNPFKGIMGRIVGVVPLRIVFWTSLDYFNKKPNFKGNSILVGSMVATLQTPIDYIIEQYKISKIGKIGFIPKTVNQFVYSYGAHYMRNIGFAVIYNYMMNMKTNKIRLRNNFGLDIVSNQNLMGFMAGMVAAGLTQPFDSLKTYFQMDSTGYRKYPWNWTLLNYFKGGYFRIWMSIIAMGSGTIVFQWK